METVVRQVDTLDSADRLAIEHVVGVRLADNQKIEIKVIEGEANHSANPDVELGKLIKLPDYFNVFEGMTDEQMAEFDRVVKIRMDLNRGAN